MDAELTCGHHAACVADLERMAAEDPFRERRWAMLMLALYRCGRQGDALRTYQRARTALATELGIEPGPELRSLERAIVAQDPSLEPPSQRYDASTLAPVGDPVVVDAPPSMLAFSPDDRLLAVGSSEDRVTLVDAERGTADPSQRLGRAGFVYVAFSPDGRRLVATNALGGASELDLTSVEPTPERIPGTEADVTVVAFSPDGRVAATGGPRGTVQFRDPDTFEPLGAPVTVGSGLIYRVAFSPDGSLVAAGEFALDDSAQVRLIDVATRQPVGDPFRGFPGPLSFGPDSTVLALPGPGGTSLWNIDPAVWRERACEIAGRNLTPTERHEYLPNDPDAAPTCSRYPG